MGNTIEDYLKSITVKITAQDKWGAGFIISNKHILTCHHVIEPCINNVTSINIKRLKDDSMLNAKKIIYDNKKLDCAIIEVGEAFDDNDIGRLGIEYNPKDKFYSIGFALNELEYGYADGDIIAAIKEDGIDKLQINSDKIDAGMSGAPVYNTRTKRIIGIISKHYKTYGHEYRDISLAIPINIIGNDIVKKNIDKYKIDDELREFLEYQMNYFIRKNPDGKRLIDYYIPNDLVKVDIDTWNKDEVDGDKWSIEEFLNGKNRFIIIAADFGTGKTSYCYSIAYKLAEEYLKNAEGYIPVLVELKNGFTDVYKNNETLDFVLNNIIDKTERNILLICDGLDEYNNTEDILKELKKVKDSNKNIKIILTTRLVKEYYDIFAKADNNPIGRQEHYVRIRPFNKEQVNEFFKNYLNIKEIEGKEAYEYFISLGLSKEEVCKPLFAYMLARIYDLDAKTLKIDRNKLNAIEEKARHRVLRTIIYHNFTYSLLRGKYNELIQRDNTYKSKKWHEFYNEEKELLRTLAALSNIYNGEVENVEEKLEVIGKNINGNIKEALDIVITSYFRQSKETIRFIHKSFQEYFLAEYYYKMISNKIDIDNKIGMFNVGLPTEECIDFLHGIIDIVMNYDKVKGILEQSHLITALDDCSIKKITNKLNSLLKDDSIILHKQMLKDVNGSIKISIKDYSVLLAYKWIAISILSWLSIKDSKFEDVADNLAEIIRLSSNVIPYYLKNLDSANLSEANLSYANLSYANLSYANLSYANLSYANLSEANLSYANLSEANLSYADLSEAKLFGADLSEAKLSRAKLSYANLSEAKLSYANLSEAKLFGADLSEAKLSRAKLSYANLSEAKLSYADLSEAKLSEANLSYADLSEAKLFGADLSEAKLSRAKLSYANLSEAKLSYANLSEANLFGANITNVIFYLFSWEDKDILNSNLADYIKLYGKDIQEYELTRNDEITLIKVDSKITIKLEDNIAILKIDDYEEELLAVKEDNQIKIFIKVYVNENTNTKGIILTYKNDKESIREALANLPPNLREIVLRDNPNYKEIWNESIN